MEVEYFCDFFVVGVRIRFHEMRCSKSCYLCDLERIALFDVVEQGVFWGNDFLIDRTADFYVTSPVASYRIFQTTIVLIFTLNMSAVCVNEYPSCATELSFCDFHRF